MSNIAFVECKDLLKCPCCNHKADMIEFQDPFVKSENWYKVSCSKCSIRTCRLSSKYQAKKTWNRRVK